MKTRPRDTIGHGGGGTSWGSGESESERVKSRSRKFERKKGKNEMGVRDYACFGSGKNRIGPSHRIRLFISCSPVPDFYHWLFLSLSLFAPSLSVHSTFSLSVPLRGV